MTRCRLAAVAALTIPVLLVVAPGGEAAKDRFRVGVTCFEKHTMDRDFFKETVEVEEQGGDNRARAARFEPVKDAKVITKLKDLTESNGDNIVDGKDVDKTNKDGIAKTKVEFDNFGDYRLKTIVKVDGDVVEREQLDVGISDRVNGKCSPALGAA